MTTPILEARNLTRHYDIPRIFGQDQLVRALNGASFKLEQGKTLAVVGESGCGKSTLARVITMIEPPTSGELVIDDKIVVPGSSEHRKTIQIVFQNPYGSLNPRHKVGTILEEPLKLNTDMDPADRRSRGEVMMERVGLRPEHYERYPHMFSGGQRQRIAIARALMLEPRILVLDEPVSALDLSIQAQILNILTDLQDELGLSYIFISHDLSVVRHFADDVMVMYLGNVVEYGASETIFSEPKHPYTAALISATPIADPEHKKDRIVLSGEMPSPITPPSGCPFHPRCSYADVECSAEMPDLAPLSDRLVACFHPLNDPKKPENGGA